MRKEVLEIWSHLLPESLPVDWAYTHKKKLKGWLEIPQFGWSTGFIWLMQLKMPHLGSDALLAGSSGGILGFPAFCRRLIGAAAESWGGTNLFLQEKPSGHFLVILLFGLSGDKVAGKSLKISGFTAVQFKTSGLIGYTFSLHKLTQVVSFVKPEISSKSRRDSALITSWSETQTNQKPE